MSPRAATILYTQYLSGRLNIAKTKSASRAVSNGKGEAIAGAKYIGSSAPAYMVKHRSGKHVAIMPVLGTLTKRGELCSYGMRDYISEIEALNKNHAISAIVLEMEGPGGTVDGTPEFGMTIKESEKPVVVFGDCMVASADYWVASQASWIIGNANNPTEFGSIGVLSVHEYWGKYIEENVGSIQIIRAPQSKDKARVNPIEELSEDQEKLIVEDLKQLGAQFHDTVKAGRGERLTASEKEWGTGKMFKNQEALSLGLIDAIGTLEDAIDKAVELTSTPATKSNANAQGAQQINKKPMKKILGKASSFFRPKRASAAAAPVAAEGDSVPMWTAELVFNTDGSEDGAFCIHADSGGTERKFETKIDNNTGNEPPTDPSITEDDNWSVVADTTEESAPEEEQASANSTVARMNVTLKKKDAEISNMKARISYLEGENKRLKDEKTSDEKKPAGPATTVVGTEDQNVKDQRPLTAEEEVMNRYAKLSQTNIFA